MRVRNEYMVSRFSRWRLTPTSASIEKVLALGVVDPAVVEEHVDVGQPERVGEPAGLHGRPGLLDVGFGMAGAQEVEAHAWSGDPDLVDGPDEGERVEPVVETTSQMTTSSPGPMPGTTPRNSAGGPLRGLVGKTEGHHVDEAAKRGVVLVGVGIDPPERGEEPEPQISLSFAGAHGSTSPGPVALRACPLCWRR